MDLRLRVEAPDHPALDLAVEIGAEARVADLTAALARAYGLPTAGLFCHLRGAWLPPEQIVLDARLRQGERLALVPPGGQPPGTAAPAGAAAILLVTGGPCSGARYPLAAGRHRVGRSPSCEVVLADAAVSGVHLEVQVDLGGAVTVADAGTANGTFADGARLQSPLAVVPGQEIEVGRSLVCFAPPGRDVQPTPDDTGHVPFNRPPRAAPRAVRLRFPLTSSPARARPTGLSISGAAVPLVMGAAMYFALGRQPLWLLIMLLSPVMVVGSFVESWVGASRRNRKEHARHGRQVRDLEGELARARQEEAARRRAASPGLAVVAERARTVQPSLWERRRDHSDFLLLRIGWGDQPSGIAVDLPAEESSQAGRARVEALVERNATLPTTPLAVSMPAVGSLGVTGDRGQVLALARNLIAQVAGLHSPRDVALAAAVDAADRELWRWLAWLPHVHPEAPVIPGPSVVADAGGARDLLDRVVQLMERRLRAGASSYGERVLDAEPAVVVVLDGAAELPRAAVDRVLTHGPACGLYVIWLGRSRAALPGACGAFVELDPATGTPAVTLAGSEETLHGFGADLSSLAVVDDLALSLAPIRDVEAAGGRAEIPHSVSLLELLDLRQGTASRIAERWRHDDDRLSARLGLGAGGQVCEVSLRHDGPHALVGGMTGAGKSELLQSLVASLAAAHAPSHLTFILVDYKGGAAFKDCVHLPHTVGFVTDLDGHLVNRALTSLRAELRRREQVLKEAGCRDLFELRARSPASALPSLTIVVDEFAALAAELPEFVDGMVDIAARGRSLGIHLVLATQRPAGVISDRIRANTNLRLSLRFADASDSQDVIGTGDAARPGLPRGRAFVRTGPDAVVEFQAAHASARTAGDGGVARVVVQEMDGSGQPVERAPAAAPDGEPASAPSDLMLVVEAARDAASALRLPAPARPWLPTLPALLPLDELEAAAPATGRAVAIGLVDDPGRQRQLPVAVDVDRDGSLLVLGTGGSGKTTLLRTLAVALARRLDPARLHLYGLDFATHGLGSLRSLPQCGDVVAADEPERALRLLHVLRRERERRRTLLAATGASSVAEHESAGGPALPRLLVLLDGYAGFRSTFEDVDLGAPLDLLRSLASDGRSLGMNFAITADRAGAVPPPLAAAMGRRLVLRLANEDEYLHAGLERSLYLGAALPPGRGFTDHALEFQVAVVGGEPAGSAQSAAIERVAADLRARYPGGSVPEVRLLPVEVPGAELPAPERSLQAVIGLEDGDLEAARVDLNEGHLLVAGPRRSGRTTAVAACAVSLSRAPGAPPLYLLAPRRSSVLRDLRVWAEVGVGAAGCAALAQRLEGALDGSADGPDLSRGAVVLLDDGEELGDSAAGPALEAIARRGRDQGVRLVAAIETQAAHASYGGWLAEVRRDRQALLLDPDPVMDGALAGGVRLPPRTAPAPPGRGYLVLSGLVALVQVAMAPGVEGGRSAGAG
jgi:DNA segregation ATPase FtsK/SpoIIIE, S-DNA-T family